MRRLLLLTLAMVFALSAASFAADILPNGNFENEVHATGWNLNNTNIKVENIAAPTYWMVPGPCPADPNGPWGIGVVTNYNTTSGQATSRVNLAGSYSFTGSGWFRLLSGNYPEAVSTATLSLIVDGVTVESVTLRGVNETWTDWTQVTLPTWTGTVTSNVRLRATLYADGQGAWGQAVGDAFTLDAVEQVVPEPSSIIALASGLVGMAGFVIRRRK